MNKVDISGKRFNRWIVIGVTSERSSCNATMWLCRCDCGVEKLIAYRSLVCGDSRSCGCLKIEESLIRFTKHGLTGSPEYRSWQSAKGRCYNPKNKKYPIYGARGIKMCERWINSFDTFLEDMGKRPSKKYSLDRFPGTYGDYEPKNCRWATMKQQGGNKTNNNWIEYNGEKK
jgi:hypothetical protein